MHRVHVELSFSQQSYPHLLLLPCSKPGMDLELFDGFNSAWLGTMLKPDEAEAESVSQHPTMCKLKVAMSERITFAGNVDRIPSFPLRDAT